MPDEKEIWVRIRTFLIAHPELFYKGVPIALAVYMALPILWTLVLWAPWIFVGYEIYTKVPKGTGTAVWAALQAYKSGCLL